MKNTDKNNKRKFKLFDMNRDGKGVYEIESRKPTFAFFFKLYFRKFTQILQLNLLMLFMVIPLIAVAIMYFMGNKTPTATELLYAPLYGIGNVAPTPDITNMLDLSSIQMEIPIFSPVMNVIIIALFLFMAVTWGWQNVGAAYVLRGLFRGDAVFVFSDYFYGIKKNLKQGFFMGLFDFVCSAVLIMDFLFFYNRTGSFGLDVMYFIILALILIWIAMRFYLYTMLVTFNLKNFKLIKNALIFSILGIKRNILAILGIIILAILHVLLTFLLLPYGIAVPLVLPLVYFMATAGFMGTYAAYPVIEKYMITPYDNEKADDDTPLDLIEQE